MKAVLISIQPKWVEKIARGEKTIEVRKTKPKLETPFKCYIYETQGEYKTGTGIFAYGIELKGTKKGRGKVIGEFVCDRIELYYYTELIGTHSYEDGYLIGTGNPCLSYVEFLKYGKGDDLYGWHISDLKIYDKPKELSEFIKPCHYTDGTHCLEHKCEYYDDYSGKCCCEVERPPQSWQFVKN